MPNERQLSPADDNPDAENRRLEDIRERERQESHSFIERNDDIARNLSTAADTLDFALFHSESLDAAQSNFRRVSAAPDISDLGVLLFGRVEDWVRVVRRNAPPEDRQSNTRRYLALVFGLVTAGVIGGSIALFELLARSAKDEPSDDINLSPKDKAQAQDLFEKWRSQPEPDFWASVARYVENYPETTIADQLYFCQYTQQLSPSSEVWIWEKDEDEVAIVETLKAIYEKSSLRSTAILYQQISQQTYQGKTFPRDLASEILALTLGTLLSD
jgi:hypothetical protein